MYYGSICDMWKISERNTLMQLFLKSTTLLALFRPKVRAAYAMETLTYLSVFQRQVCNINVSMIFKQNRRICLLRFQILEYIILINTRQQQ
jgi:hypothetical protein